MDRDVLLQEVQASIVKLKLTSVFAMFLISLSLYGLIAADPQRLHVWFVDSDFVYSMLVVGVTIQFFTLIKIFPMFNLINQYSAD
jgi:uncharacterized membrane protein YqjE